MPPTLKQLAYRYLREKLESGSLRPGDLFSELALSKEIGISRTPVREAINQLAAEGLAELVPHAGVFVRQANATEIEELYEVRIALEGLAAKKAATTMTKADMDKLNGLNLTLKTLLTKAQGRHSGMHFLGRFHCVLCLVLVRDRYARLVRSSIRFHSPSTRDIVPSVKIRRRQSMPDIGKAIKDEIRRLAKSEAKTATDPLKKQIAGLREDVWKLKQENGTLKKEVTVLSKAAGTIPRRGGAGRPRVTARTIKSQRKGLGLSQGAFAQLLGVSMSSVVNWEAGRNKPRQEQIEKILDARGLGRREAKKKLGKKG